MKALGHGAEFASVVAMVFGLRAQPLDRHIVGKATISRNIMGSVLPLRHDGRRMSMATATTPMTIDAMTLRQLPMMPCSMGIGSSRVSETPTKERNAKPKRQSLSNGQAGRSEGLVMLHHAVAAGDRCRHARKVAAAQGSRPSRRDPHQPDGARPTWKNA